MLEPNLGVRWRGRGGRRCKTGQSKAIWRRSGGSDLAIWLFSRSGAIRRLPIWRISADLASFAIWRSGFFCDLAIWLLLRSGDLAGPFGPIRAHSEPIRAHSSPFGSHSGPFGPIRVPFGPIRVLPGPFGSHSGPIRGPFRDAAIPFFDKIPRAAKVARSTRTGSPPDRHIPIWRSGVPARSSPDHRRLASGLANRI